MFKGAGKRVDNALVEQVYERFGGCTWYLQMMMNELFSLTTENGSIGTGMFDTAFDNIIRVQAAMKPLMEYDYITKTDGAYRVSDYFFAEWLRRSL